MENGEKEMGQKCPVRNVGNDYGRADNEQQNGSNSKKIKYKKLIILSFVIGVFISGFLILNLEVSIMQGVNYRVSEVKMPLYVKIMDFLARSNHYKLLVAEIIKDCKNDEEKLKALFKWTSENIRKTPEDFPVIDDHVFNIIIRGYGMNDQSADVLAVLCNYAGVEAFFTWVYSEDRLSRVPVVFAFINKKWSIFDPYNGNWFIDDGGMFASIDDLKTGFWEINRITTDSSSVVDYSCYFKQLNVPEKSRYRRSNIQNPLNRLIYEIKKRF